MSRDIKFRAWEDGDRFMIKDFQTKDCFQSVLIGMHEYAGDYKIMQYTGLKDKNGVEIYEGDVIACSDIYGQYIGKIEWWNDRWTLNYRHLNESQNQALMTVNTPEVVGNIYENPSLIDESK